MTTGKILVQKWNMEEIDLETILTLHKEVEESLPANIKAVVIPHTWEFKEIDDKAIYVGMDYYTDIDTSAAFLSNIRKTLGEEYTVVANLCKAEVIREKH